MIGKKPRDLKTFIIKHTVIASALTWLIGSQIRTFSTVILDTLVDPFFSVDLDNDGKPDLKQLDNLITDFLGCKFPLGKLFMETIKVILTLVLLYIFVNLFIKYTDLM